MPVKKKFVQYLQKIYAVFLQSNILSMNISPCPYMPAITLLKYFHLGDFQSKIITCSFNKFILAIHKTSSGITVALMILNHFVKLESLDLYYYWIYINLLEYCLYMFLNNNVRYSSFNHRPADFWDWIPFQNLLIE